MLLCKIQVKLIMILKSLGKEINDTVTKNRWKNLYKAVSKRMLIYITKSPQLFLKSMKIIFALTASSYQDIRYKPNKRCPLYMTGATIYRTSTPPPKNIITAKDEIKAANLPPI